MAPSQINYRNWMIAFSTSVLFNFIMLGLFYLNYKLNLKPFQYIELYIEQNVSPESSETISSESNQQPPSKPSIDIGMIPETSILPDPEIINEFNNISKEQDAWTKHVKQIIKSQKLMTDTINFLPKDSALSLFLLKFSMDDLVPPTDPMGDVIYQHGSGGVGLQASKAKPIDLPEKEYPLTLDFTPDPVHIMVMGTLYNHGNSHQNQIYSNLPDTLKMTAQKFDTVLEFLYHKGLLKRKKISAENKLLALFIPIELSKKNKRNPLYLYEPMINKELLKLYLNSLITETADSTAQNRNKTNYNTHQLMELLNL